MTARDTGIIRHYNPDKGYGFVAEGSPDNLFFHVSEARGLEEELGPGVRISFERGTGRNGKPCARDIRIVAEAPHSRVTQAGGYV
jgi:cold shock CspA family protein